jgi:hypothetical protein
MAAVRLLLVGGARGRGGGGRGRGSDDDDDHDIEQESAIALAGAFCLRLLRALGVPVSELVASLERRFDFVRASSRVVKLAELYALHESASIASRFFLAASSVVNKFGKVIYVMFFLVVHLMKLHSLSLIWGVTTEAMEYAENAERRREVPAPVGGEVMAAAAAAGRHLRLRVTRATVAEEASRASLR